MSAPVILVPIDFSPASHDAVRCAVALAARRGASIQLLHAVVASPLAPMTGPLPDLADPETLAAARDFLATLPTPTPRLTAEDILGVGSPAADAIVCTAQAHAVDLIVMAAHPHGRLRRLFGTTASQVAKRAPCPVITVRTPRTPEDDLDFLTFSAGKSL